MERRIKGLVDSHFKQFKTDICTFIGKDEAVDPNSLMQFIYDYNSIELNTEDFAKRKRVKNSVPLCERCMAKRSTGEQCTRRKKDGEMYCGTHVKGTPHGFITPDTQTSVSNVNRLEVWVQEFRGISYYIDRSGNVYQTEDIISNKKNPKVISKYKVEMDGEEEVYVMCD